jgi:transmembrane sensor
MDRGQAIFHVAKDASRPFVVDAAQTQVKAVGTVFSVQRNAESVVVAVAEGRVEVRSTATAVQDPARAQVLAAVALRANERIAVSARGIAGPISHVDTATTDAWAKDQLVFENARVEDVAARFNRLNQVQIRIMDSELASLTVSGVFDSNDPRSFVDFLETDAGASSFTNGFAEIVVTPNSTEHRRRP